MSSRCFVILACLAAAVALASTAKAETVAYWTFDGSGDAFLADSWGSHTLASAGAVRSDDAAVGSGSAFFDGASIMNTVSKLDLTAYESVTISWRQKVTGSGMVFEQTVDCMAQAGNERGAFYQYAGSDGYLEAAIRGEDGVAAPVFLDSYTHTGSVDTGWVSMSVTFDRIASNPIDVIRQVRNGTPVGTEVYMNSCPDMFANEVFFVGGRGAGGLRLTGQIDDLKIEGTIPEPASLVLLAIGLFGLLTYAWRKRR